MIYVKIMQKKVEGFMASHAHYAINGLLAQIVHIYVRHFVEEKIIKCGPM
jgi:hypothetical protein